MCQYYSERQHGIKPPAPRSIEPIIESPEIEPQVDPPKPPQRRHRRRSRNHKAEAAASRVSYVAATELVKSTDNTSVQDAGSGTKEG